MPDSNEDFEVHSTGTFSLVAEQAARILEIEAAADRREKIISALRGSLRRQYATSCEWRTRLTAVIEEQTRLLNAQHEALLEVNRTLSHLSTWFGTAPGDHKALLNAAEDSAMRPRSAASRGRRQDIESAVTSASLGAVDFGK